MGKYVGCRRAPFNHGLAGMVVTNLRKVSAARGRGEVGFSFVKCEDARSVFKETLIERRGRIRPETMEAVEDRLRILLGLLFTTWRRLLRQQ